MAVYKEVDCYRDAFEPGTLSAAVHQRLARARYQQMPVQIRSGKAYFVGCQSPAHVAQLFRIYAS